MELFIIFVVLYFVAQAFSGSKNTSRSSHRSANSSSEYDKEAEAARFHHYQQQENQRAYNNGEHQPFGNAGRSGL